MRTPFVAARIWKYVDAGAIAQDVLELSAHSIQTFGSFVQPPGQNMNHGNSMTPQQIARARIEGLKREHRDLDEAIAALTGQSLTSSLTLQRLKKQKLALKDQIARLEDELTPDIIA